MEKNNVGNFLGPPLQPGSPGVSTSPEFPVSTEIVLTFKGGPEVLKKCGSPLKGPEFFYFFAAIEAGNSNF